MEFEDLLNEEEARELIRPSSDHAWRRWHEQRIIPHIVIPGTRERRYSRRELVEWVKMGRRAP